MLRELIFSSARTFQHRLALRWPGRQGFHPLANLSAAPNPLLPVATDLELPPHGNSGIVDENSMDCPGFPILCFFLGVTCLHERHTHDAAVSEQSDLSAAACFGRATAKPSNRSMPWRASISVEWDE
jgi:hypothetical protein